MRQKKQTLYRKDQWNQELVLWKDKTDQPSARLNQEREGPNK